jgi:hypothetical protein
LGKAEISRLMPFLNSEASLSGLDMVHWGAWVAFGEDTSKSSKVFGNSRYSKSSSLVIEVPWLLVSQQLPLFLDNADIKFLNFNSKKHVLVKY